MPIRYQNAAASLFLTSLIYYFYMHSQYILGYLNKNVTLNLFGIETSFWVHQIFDYLLIIYIIGFILIYFLESKPELSKSVLSLQGILRIITAPNEAFEKGIPREEKTAILTVLVKMFYIPLMVPWLLGNAADCLSTFSAVILNYQQSQTITSLFQSKTHFFLYNLLMTIDVFCFTMGYLIEHKALGNKVLSVEPTLFGWAIALACYPPFNDTINAALLPVRMNDVADFSNPFLFVITNTLIIILMTIYAWGSISLGLKASNLTHRGIVDYGPYRYIRHPAYICKNTAWWIAAIPVFGAVMSDGYIHGFYMFLAMVGWTTIYFYRALTEERHLQTVNAEYSEYKKKVPYRFIPKII